MAKVTRVEPSLQAAFVDYGGNRHGFLAFSEIHPDYYQIPIADRQALLDEEALSQRDEEDNSNGERRSRRHRRPRHSEIEARAPGESLSEIAASEFSGSERRTEATEHQGSDEFESNSLRGGPLPESQAIAPADLGNSEWSGEDERSDLHKQGVVLATDENAKQVKTESDAAENQSPETAVALEKLNEWPRGEEQPHDDDDHEVTTLEDGAEERFAPHRKDRLDDEGEPVEQIGGDALEEVPRRPHRLRRQYKIQEVIKRRQVLLVQVVKEERGNKGAALTTYLSLAGRYSVLMPNTARGGGISRKITNAQDRSRLKGIAEELDVPEGMGVILRTAGASRTKAEVKRDSSTYSNVGDRSGDDARFERADTRLRRGLAYKACDTRSLQQRGGRNYCRRRSRIS